VVGSSPYVTPYAYPNYGYYYPSYGYYPYAPAYAYRYASPYYGRPATSFFFSIPFGGGHGNWGHRGWRR
jgi:hypothetical protein